MMRQGEVISWPSVSGIGGHVDDYEGDNYDDDELLVGH